MTSNNRKELISDVMFFAFIFVVFVVGGYLIFEAILQTQLINEEVF